MISPPLSAIIMVVAAVFAVTGRGNTEESITRSCDVPRTLSSVSTTEFSRLPHSASPAKVMCCIGSLSNVAF